MSKEGWCTLKGGDKIFKREKRERLSKSVIDSNLCQKTCLSFNLSYNSIYKILCRY